MGEKLVMQPASQPTGVSVPSTPSAGALIPMPMLNERHPVVYASITEVRQEVDDAFADMKTFLSRNPDEIMRIARGHSARLSELRVRIMRCEDSTPQWRSVRQREIEPCLEELREQYACASRLESVRELDWKMESGGT
jgi:hypothetical protein